MALHRREILAAATGGAALALAGKAQASVTATPGLRPGKPFAGTELKVLCVVASQFRAHEARLAAFTEQTGITAKYTFVPFASMREALTAEMVGGGGDYDLAIAMDQWVASLNNLFDPIDDIVRTKGIPLDRWPEAHLRQGRVNNRLLGLPSRGHVQLLFYRKDLFEKHNLTPPATWEALVETGRAIQEKEPGISGVSVPYGRGNGQNLMVWYNFLWGRGAQLFDAQGQPAFNSAAGLQSVQDYVDLLRRHRIAPAGSLSFAEQDSVNFMGQGNAAMLPVWWWVRSTLVNPQSSRLTEAQLGFAPMPSYAGRPRTTFTNTWVWGISRRSRRKEAAAELLTWIANPALEKEVLLDPRESDVVAVMQPNLVDDQVNARFGGMHRFAAEGLARTESITFGPEWPQIAEALETAMSEAASGSRTVPDAFNAAAAQVRRIVRRG
ncbi:sugar ABC transporter substrate-binding protein [Roseomonas stagni]|uniref:Sugar ABC transporter substrate-binding protein n=1 Tax=Falsiroseomonas algicola TaxID=2716930 RepID=A0A6M1LJ77_9PROT|nr:sugar ABC transporter substrate-binding protein [Falsiroseomonas algicola]NGM20395.1 sugar ABC transporter substrate-binding protein [Falsiroseomonas algicola]